MMIDIAEREFRIDIRKNARSEQFKSTQVKGKKA